MTPADVRAWLATHPLTPSEVDCVTAVMLKILDGKCKMPEWEKPLMAALYDAAQGLPGQQFGASEHALIAQARTHADDTLRQTLYEHRVLAETAISRPVMKAFKAMIRDQGLFAGLAAPAGAEDET